MARPRTRLDEWLAEQDERESDSADGEIVLRALTAVVTTAAVIYLGGHIVAALVR